MSTATERMLILVTKADKAKYVRRAKSFGLSISEFARTAMDSIQPTDENDLDRRRWPNSNVELKI